jgi:hypothetical protein
LGAACRGSVREEEVREVLGEDVGSRSGERVRAVDHHLVVDANRDDIAPGDGLEFDLVVGGHHAESLLNTQVKGVAHTPGDVPTEGTEAARHRAPNLRLAFLDLPACLEGGGPQLLQLLLRGVVGRLDSLRLGCRVPQRGLQA